ncbi:MAG: immunoglobulin domain-containing protein [Opitutaceae bacterium]|nr:immunoglobulin domain-containing protein [Opitutaceae bacterium]
MKLPFSSVFAALFVLAVTVADALASPPLELDTPAIDAVVLTAATSAPVITVPPTAQSVLVGTTVVFSVTATGSPDPTYQWQRNYVDIPGANEATLTIPNAQGAAVGFYRVRVSNSIGTVTSSNVSLAVSSEASAPVFTTHPQPLAVLAGSTAVFTVTVAGTPTPTYRWQKDLVDIAGATLPTLSLPNVQALAAGSYRVIATNPSGSATSNAAVLTVNAAPPLPTITGQPMTQTAIVGASVTIYVTAVGGTPALTYQWQKDGVEIPGATTFSLALANLQLDATGTYRVVVTNRTGSVTSDAAVLTVNEPPAIVEQPVPQSVGVGGEATFTVTATGTPAPTFQWKKGDAPIPGATQASLSLSNVQTGDAGIYRVVVTNVVGSVTSAAAALTIGNQPVIHTQPNDITVMVGTSVGFEVFALGIPAPTYQWYLNGQAVAGLTGPRFPAFVTEGYHNGATFHCVATNSAGATASRTATLTVWIPAAPVVTTQPADLLGDIGTIADFTVAATGEPAPTYQWYLNGAIAAGHTAPRFGPFTLAAYHNGYTFACVVTNAYGTTTSHTATLTVGSPVPPVIVNQPQSLGGVVGQTGAVGVEATGAWSYQWFKGGATVAGATAATLTFANLEPTDAGIYDVTATGASGETLSAPVVVGVVPAAGARTAGQVATRAEWQDLQHANGVICDQFLLTGAAGTITADAGQVARLSYLDENESIVQVELSGAGAITVVLARASGPLAPALYNQPGIQYMKGKATVILSGADATTHFTIYSVGTATNPGVTRPDVAYAGWADVAAAGIVSTDGKLGGIHQGNVAYAATAGLTGIYAPSVTAVGGLGVVHSITADGAAFPYLYFGTGGTVVVRIAGSALAQPSGDGILVGGLAQVQMGAGQDSCGRAAPARAIQGRLVDDADADVTSALVVNP